MRRTGIAMAVLAALVAATMLIVYGFASGPAAPPLAKAEAETFSSYAEGRAPLSLAEGEAPAPQGDAPLGGVVQPEIIPAAPDDRAPASDAPKPLDAAPKAPLEGLAPLPGQDGAVLYDLNQLPAAIKRTLQDIIEAAQAGDIEEMRAVLEQNELRPMLSSDPVGDPIAYWKKVSADGEGRDILAAMLNVFGAGYVRKGEGKDAMYIWPYFADSDLTKLTPAQQIELYRLVPAPEALAMLRGGKYSYYRAGIGNDGVWHYFMR